MGIPKVWRASELPAPNQAVPFYLVTFTSWVTVNGIPTSVISAIFQRCARRPCIPLCCLARRCTAWPGMRLGAAVNSSLLLSAAFL